MVRVMEVVEVKVVVVVLSVNKVVETTTDGEGVELKTVLKTVTSVLDNGVEVTKIEVGSVVNDTIIGVGEKAKWGTFSVKVVVATGIGMIVGTVVKYTVLVIMTELVEEVVVVKVDVPVVVSVITWENKTSLICVKVIVEVSNTGESVVVVIVTV
jgi:hypothetical protein